jgi:hypothetical protein
MQRMEVVGKQKVHEAERGCKAERCVCAGVELFITRPSGLAMSSARVADTNTPMAPGAARLQRQQWLQNKTAAEARTQ